MAKDHQLTTDEIDALILHYQSELRKLQFQIAGIENAINNLMGRASTSAPQTAEKPAEAEPAKAPRGSKKAEKVAKSPKSAKTPKAAKAPKAAKTPPPVEETSAPAEPAPAEETPNKRRPRITVKPPKPLAPTKEKGRRGRPKATTTPADATEVANVSAEAPKRGRKPGQTPKAAKAEKADDDAKGKGYRLSVFDNYILEALNTRGHVLISSDLISFIEAKYQENNESFTEEDLKTRLSRSLHKMVNRRGDIKQVKYSGRGHAYALPAWVGEDGETKSKFRRK
jgi:hypothetical protein